jgi:sigma-E factor negative regulatory protein RseC
MLTETGRVLAVEGDGLWVETLRQSTCGACAAQSGCGHGLLNRLGNRGRNTIRILVGEQHSEGYAPGDEVRFAVPERLVLSGSVIVYLLPLFCMLLFAAGLARLPLSLPVDVMAVTGAILGFLMGMALVRLHAWRHRDDPQLQPRLLGRVSPASVTGPAEVA